MMHALDRNNSKELQVFAVDAICILGGERCFSTPFKPRY